MLLHAASASAAMTVTNIALGCTASHSLFILSDGSAWGMGRNDNGELGNSPKINLLQPEKIIAGGVTAAAVGRYHSLFLKSDGSLWAMGAEGSPLGFGQLGDGTWISYTNQPEQIVSGGVITIAAGAGHSLFIKSDGSLWAMGANNVGQLGDGAPISPSSPGVNIPEQIVASGVVAVAAGTDHSLFLKSDGSLWAMGSNQYGQLGDTNSFGVYPYAANQPQQIVACGVRAIAAGHRHSLFLKTDGSVWGMGANPSGALGGEPQEIVAGNVIAIAAGQDHDLFLKSDGSLWAMGSNNSGQLGAGPTIYYTNQPLQIITGGVTAIAAGYGCSMFIKTDGSLWAMGSNQSGQLGDGFGSPSIDDSMVPEQIMPKPQPILLQTITNADLQFTATCGFGGDFYLLTCTNLAQPLGKWTPVWTNTISYRYENIFTATLTNAVNASSQQFYLLQSQ
jgi:alpha-tubulin suppressor-like RCC1 family protein